jgi:hypothetical protein
MVLLQCPGVHDCAVFGIPDDEFGESLAAAVEPMPGATLTVAAVQDFLSARLSGYKVPSAWTSTPRCRARTAARSSSGDCETRSGKAWDGASECTTRRPGPARCARLTLHKATSMMVQPMPTRAAR